MGWVKFACFFFFFDLLIDGLRDSILESLVFAFGESLIFLKKIWFFVVIEKKKDTMYYIGKFCVT